jgi:type II secretory pathway pseudopilin PulG
MKSSQRGMTLIEVLGALAIGILLLFGLTAMIDTSMEDLKGQQTALHQEQVVNAARKYIADNYTALLTSTGGGVVVPITVAQLRTSNYLSAGFSITNAYRQTPCVLVRQPAAGKLDALIATYGGQTIGDRDLPTVAMHAGQGGGYINKAYPTEARGASWKLVAADLVPYRGVACSGTIVLTSDEAEAADKDSGHLVSSLFYDGPGQPSTEFLYRKPVDGRPELNRMDTVLRMGNDALAQEGANCKTVANVAEPGIALDGITRQLLSCGADGLWRSTSQWREARATYADLPLTGNTEGDVRIVTSLDRAFVYDAVSATWRGLALNQHGDFNMEGQLTVGKGATVAENIIATLDISGRDLSATRDVSAGRHVNVTRDVNVGRDVLVQGGVEAVYMISENYEVGDVFAPGDACNYMSGGFLEYPIGSIVVDSAGRLLTCQTGSRFKYGNGTLTP